MFYVRVFYLFFPFFPPRPLSDRRSGKIAGFELPGLGKGAENHLSPKCECKHSEPCLKCKLANYFSHLTLAVTLFVLESGAIYFLRRKRLVPKG